MIELLQPNGERPAAHVPPAAELPRIAAHRHRPDLPFTVRASQADIISGKVENAGGSTVQ